MTTWLSNSSRTFLDAVRDLLWRQWSSLGVPGATGETREWIVDPEALLVGTIQFARYDPRLFDAALDWCLAHGKWMSTTRLRWLRKNLTHEEARVLAATASALASQDRSAKWRALRARGEDTPIPLFLTADDRPLPLGTTPDPTFLPYGVVRPPGSAAAWRAG